MEQATENLCTAVQMMATYNLPYRFYPLLCTTLQIISRGSVNPLGNNHQSFNAVPKAQYACYEACREIVSRELEEAEAKRNEELSPDEEFRPKGRCDQLGQGNVGAIRRIRMRAGIYNKLLCSNPLLRDFSDFITSGLKM